MMLTSLLSCIVMLPHMEWGLVGAYCVDGVEQPVACTLRTLSAAEQNYAQIEREALGVIFGAKWFNQYLYGHEFTLATVHCPLCTLFRHTHGVHH